MKHTKRTLKAQPKGLWMYLPEDNRVKLLKLMTIQGVSGRELARSAGWRSHTYMQRLLRGEVRTLDPGPAAGIAHRVGVGVDDLFLVRRTRVSGGIIKRRRAS